MALINARQVELDNASVKVRCLDSSTHHYILNIIQLIQASKEEGSISATHTIKKQRTHFEKRLSLFKDACKMLSCDDKVTDVLFANRTLNISETTLYKLKKSSLNDIRVSKGHINRFADVVRTSRNLLHSRIRTKCSRIAYEYTFHKVRNYSFNSS